MAEWQPGHIRSAAGLIDPGSLARAAGLAEIWENGWLACIMSTALTPARADPVTFAWPRRSAKARRIIWWRRPAKKLVAEKKDLREVLPGDPRVTAQLDVKKLADLFESMAYQGASQALVDRLLASLDT
jgi:3-carboxy-cis,cis-muconate cycloisomerase